MKVVVGSSCFQPGEGPYFSVIVQLHRLIVYTALHVTRVQVPGGGPGAEERGPAQHSVPRAVPPHQLHGRPHAAGAHLCSSILPSILL